MKNHSFEPTVPCISFITLSYLKFANIFFTLLPHLDYPTLGSAVRLLTSTISSTFSVPIINYSKGAWVLPLLTSYHSKKVPVTPTLCFPLIPHVDDIYKSGEVLEVI